MNHPLKYLTEYWEPIAPYIRELIDVIYGTTYRIVDGVKSQATCETFKAVLVRALEHCQTLSETPVNFPQFNRLLSYVGNVLDPILGTQTRMTIALTRGLGTSQSSSSDEMDSDY